MVKMSGMDKSGSNGVSFGMQLGESEAVTTIAKVVDFCELGSLITAEASVARGVR